MRPEKPGEPVLQLPMATGCPAWFVRAGTLVVIDGDVNLRSAINYPLVVVLGDVTVDGPIHNDLVVVDQVLSRKITGVVNYS